MAFVPRRYITPAYPTVHDGGEIELTKVLKTIHTVKLNGMFQNTPF
jgi:hypothetical protein